MDIFDRLGTNPTQVVGALSFAMTTLACLNASRSSTSREARVWKVLSFVNAFFLLEVIVKFRFLVLEFARATLRQEGLYDELHGRIQEIVVVTIATAALLLTILFLLWRPIPGGAARLATSMTVIIFTSFVMEMISLHELDAVLYQTLGPLLMIGWVWTGAAALICFAAVGRCGKGSTFRLGA
jgi:hypothetical protein